MKLAQFLDIDMAAFAPNAQGPSKLSDPYRHQPLKQFAPSDTIPIRGPAKNSSNAVQLGDNEDIGRAGELVYAVAKQPPVHGQDCVVELHNGEGHLKQSDRRTDKDISCKQLDPSGEWKHSATNVKAIHAVMGRG